MFFRFVLSKPQLVVCFVLLLMAFGIVAYENLPLEAYPDVANMQVRVITQVPGKAAEEVERLVTIPIEKELNGIPRSEPSRSISIFGLSVITVIFEDGVDPYVARQQVLERLAQAAVPANVQPQLDPNASPCGEVYRYTVEGDHWSTTARKAFQDWVLNREFKAVPGIVDVTGFGGPTKAYQVEIDPDRLRAVGLTQAQVADAIAQSNGSTGGSYIVRNDQNYMVRGIGLLRSANDIANVVVSTSQDGIPVKVSDVAKVTVGEAVRKGQVGLNDQDDVVEGIILMRRGENPSIAVENISKAWPDIVSSLPPGMRLEPLYDRTALVRHTMETISHNVAEGIVLVVVILMLYLFQIRSAVICAVVIPLALMTAFILLNLFKVPGNLLSLGAIDFGIIVDGAIVMVENIIRHLGVLDHTRNEIALRSTIARAAAEVAKPILFATSIIIVTFLPILTLQGVEGRLFRPLAVTMNFNLLGAVLCSMTAIPVLCLLVFRLRMPSHRESPIMHMAEKIYRPLLRWSMRNHWKIALIAASIVGGSLLLTPFLGSEFIPELEEGNIWLRVTVLPTSVSLNKAVSIAREIRRVIKTYPEATNVVTQIGTPDDGTDPNNYSNIEVFVDLKPQSQWRKQFRDKDDLVNQMSNELNAAMPGFLYNFSQYIKDNMDETISGVKGELAIKVYGQDLDILSSVGEQIKKCVEKVPGIVDVAVDQLLGQPQVLVTIDRDRAARYGINSNQILDIVETSVGGKSITEVLEGEQRFAVILRYQKDFRSQADELQNILVSTATGQRIPLAQVATISEGHGASTILRDKNSRRVAIKANIRGRDLCSAVFEAQKNVAQSVKMPEGYHIVWGGQFERAQEAMKDLTVIMPITLGLVFLLLYTALGSARTALLVMLSVPLALPGAIVALLLTGTHLSISAGVGFIALFGVSVQNGVILVSLVKGLVHDGIELSEAVYTSAMVRMKPALMTTTVAVAGLMPAAISTGIGAQSQRPFAIVIVGGLIPAILLSLMVLPSLYEVFENAFTRKQVESVPETAQQ
jgi:cobalt-zinc-cadmium resistance protein CzcA